MYSTIRFVGGPWHNRLEHVEIVPRVLVNRQPQKLWGMLTWKQDLYYLAEFFTGMGTSYHQYVHSSLVKGNKAHTSTHHEFFPGWRIHRREIEQRLVAAGCRKRRGCCS